MLAGSEIYSICMSAVKENGESIIWEVYEAFPDPGDRARTLKN